MVNVPPNNSEKEKKLNPEELKSKFLHGFKNKTMGNSEESDLIPLYNDLLDNKSLDKSIVFIKEFNDFIKIQKDKNTDLKDFKISDFTLLDMQVLFGGFTRPLLINRNILKKKLINEFELGNDDKMYNAEILPKVKNLTSGELGDLVNSKNKRKKFIKELNTLNVPDQKIKFQAPLAKSFQEDVEKIHTNGQIDENKKLELLKIIYSISLSDSTKPWDGDIKIAFKDLFDLDSKLKFLSIETKRGLILGFLPFLSLKDATNKGLLSFDKAVDYIIKEEKLENKIEKGSSTDFEYRTILKEYIVSNHLFDSIFLDSKDFISDDNLTKKLFLNSTQEITNGFFEDINSDFADINEDVNKESFEELKNSLMKEPFSKKLENIEKFNEGCVMKVIVEEDKSITTTRYIRVTNIDYEKKVMSQVVIGKDNKINLGLDKNPSIIKFSDFKTFLEKGKLNIKFFNIDEIKDIVKNYDSSLKSSDLLTCTEDDLSDSKKRKKYKDTYIKDKTLELSKKREELDKKILNGEKDVSALELEILGLENIVNGGEEITEDDLLYHLNIKSLLEKLDGIDPKGVSLGIEKGIYLETDSDGGVHEVTGVDKQRQLIEVTTLANQKVVLNFDEFYEAFKKQKTRRVKKIKDFSALIKTFQDQGGADSTKWNGFDFVNGNLEVKEEKEGIKGKKVEYFISDTTDEIIKVSSINGDQVTIQYGERKKRRDLYDKKKGKKTYSTGLNPDKKFKNDLAEEKYNIKLNEEVLFMDTTPHILSLNDFKRIIESEKDHFRPDLKTGKEVDLTAKKDDKTFNNSWLKAYMQWGSFETLFTAGNMIYDGIEGYLNKGRDLRAAKRAMKSAGFFGIFSEELQSEIRIKVEREESEAMDKALEDLKKIDSWMAVLRIRDWLLCKNTPEYQKEAGLMFMLANYGHLTTKWSLAPYRGQFLWYKAFGGVVGDSLFREQQKFAEESNITFSEENLMHMLLKKQCGGSGYKGIKRRSRLHKEFEGKWKAGIEGEYEKGQKDAKNKRTAKDMLKGAMQEIETGTTTNGMGWLEIQVNRGDSIENMSEGFFALLYSGALYDVDQASFLKFKAMWEGAGMPIAMAGFSATKSDMKLFNETVLTLSYDLEKQYPEFAGAYKEAKDLYDVADNDVRRRLPKNDEKKRLTKAVSFWRKYGKNLARALHMVNTDDLSTSKTDNIISLKRDENSVYGRYYSRLKGLTELGNVFDKNFIDDACGLEGVGGMNNNRIAKTYFKHQQGGGFYETEIGPRVREIISKDLSSVYKKEFSNDPEENIRYKRKYVFETLRDIVGAFIEMHGGNAHALSAVQALTSAVGQDFEKWGINLFNFLNKYDSNKIRSGEADSLLEIAVNNIVDGNFDSNYGDALSIFTDSIKTNVKNNLSADQYWDDDLSKTA